MKKVYELTTEEFKNAIEKSGMSDELFNDVLDLAFWNVEDITRYFYNNGKYSIDFSIGYADRSNHINPVNTAQFLSDCLDLQKDFCVFSDDLFKKIERMEERATLYADCENGYASGLNEEDEYNFVNWFENGLDALCKELLDSCVSEYDYHVDNMYEIALELDLYSDYFLDTDGKLYKKTAPVYMCNGKTFATYAEMAAEYNRTHEEQMPLF